MHTKKPTKFYCSIRSSWLLSCARNEKQCIIVCAPIKIDFRIVSLDKVLDKYFISVSRCLLNCIHGKTKWIHEWWCTRIGIRMSLDRFSRTYNDLPCTFRAASSEWNEEKQNTKKIWKKNIHISTCVHLYAAHCEFIHSDVRLIW